MSGCENILRADLVKSENFANIVLPNVQSDRRNPKDYILFNTAPAGLFSGKSDPIRFGRLATIRERLALSVFRHNAKFHSMPNVNEISGKVNNSTRTASKKAAKPAVKPIYKVSLRAIGTWAADYKNGVYSSDIYQASNQEEAIGMACEHIKAKFPHHSILADEIKCSLLNPAAL